MIKKWGVHPKDCYFGSRFSSGNSPGFKFLHGYKNVIAAAVAVALCVLSLFSLSGCSAAVINPETINSFLTQGYVFAEFDQKFDSQKGVSFLAGGASGRLDRIYADGTLERVSLPVGDKYLTSIFVDDAVTIIGGLQGTLIWSDNGATFSAASGAGDEHILGFAKFKGVYYACTYSGKVLSSGDGKSWVTAANLTDKPLVGIATDEACIMAFTTDTDIFKSVDSKKWDHQNYNEIYKGLSESLFFMRAQSYDGNIFILGNSLEDPDYPKIMSSVNSGELWYSIPLLEINEMPPEDFLPITVNAVCHYAGEMLAACDKGRLLTFTDCPTCNYIEDISGEDLRCIAIEGSVLLVAGNGFEYKILDAEQMRLDNLDDVTW